MAVARLVCGDCGGVLAPSDLRCPSCGASIEREAAPRTDIVCGSCGRSNPAGTAFCSSCGSRLGAPSVPDRPKKDRPPRPAPGREPRTRKFDPWQIISAVALLGFLSYWVYLKVIEDRPAAQSSQAPPPSQGGSPLATFNAQPVDLTPLEDAVKARPADAAARLRLANALSDTHTFPRAIEAYRAYLAMRPGDPDARTDLGICYFQMALADSVRRDTLLRKAAAEMETAFTRAPRPHQASAFNLGVVYLHLEQVEESNKWFSKAVEINGDSELGRRARNMITQHTIPQ